MIAAAKAEIVLAGFDIAIEQHLFVAPVARRADEDRVLLSLFHARVVGPWAIGRRDAALVLFDAAADLAIDLVDERLVRRLEGLGEIGVLRLDIAADVGRQGRGILHHLLPVIGPQPVIGILPGDAVMSAGMLAAFGDGWGGHGRISMKTRRVVLPYDVIPAKAGT